MQNNRTFYKVYSKKYDLYFYFWKNGSNISQYSKYIHQYFNDDFNNEMMKIKNILKSNLNQLSSKERLTLLNKSLESNYFISKTTILYPTYKSFRLNIYNNKKTIKDQIIDVTQKWNLKRMFWNNKSESQFVESIEKKLFEFLCSPSTKNLNQIYTIEINDSYKMNIEFFNNN